MFITKKEHKQRLDTLDHSWRKQLENTHKIFEANFASATHTISEQRKRIEQLTLTPEAALDSEGAYRRGFEQARRNLYGWLHTGISQLEAEFDNDEKTEEDGK